MQTLRCFILPKIGTLHGGDISGLRYQKAPDLLQLIRCFLAPSPEWRNVRVEEGSKRKLAELLGEADRLAYRIEAIKEQVSAIDQVIAIYDPAHTAQSAARAERKRSRQEIPIPIELTKLNKTVAILEVLCEAREPLSSVNFTSRIAADDPALPRFVRHASAGLNSLMKSSRVRLVGSLDDRKHLSEVTA